MKKRTSLFFLLNVMAVSLLIISCASKPKQELLDELNAAMLRAQNGREKALAVQGQVYFKDEWNRAESNYNGGKSTDKNSVESVRQGIALYNTAADGYEAIARKAGPLFAKDKDDADKALQAAKARADKSRQDAQDNQGPKYFPDEFASAEAAYQNGLDAKKGSLEEMKAAAAIFNSAADSYDAIAGKSRPLMAKEKDDANKALQAAMARAEKSRQAAMNVEGQTYFPDDWKNAEDKNTSAKNAKKTTIEEITAATALFVSAADAYDNIANKSQPKYAKDKADADKALQAAIARMEKSRKDVQDAKGNVNLPNDWNAAETKNKTASGAKRGTIAEIKAATPLYISAANAYDDILKKNVASVQKAADDAKARAEQERKKAVDAKADIASAKEFNNADTVFKQAAGELAKKSLASATDLYNKSADQFIAAAALTEKKRALANQTIGEAKQKSNQSSDFAINTGNADGGKR